MFNTRVSVHPVVQLTVNIFSLLLGTHRKAKTKTGLIISQDQKTRSPLTAVFSILIGFYAFIIIMLNQQT